MDIRVGHGYDVHAFTTGHEIVLGGVTIPHDKAFLAHSDGDVLLHAICDALLGALALGDIGKHFPDSSSEFKDIDSRLLLRHVHGLIHSKGYQIQNLDSVIMAESPKMAKYIDPMRENIASDLQTTIDRVGVKATTTEKLGYIGRGEGVGVSVTVLLISL